MPMINIKYDDKKVKDEEIIFLSEAVQKIVKETTEIEDVFVYADSSKIKVDVAPIEVFVEMSRSIVLAKEKLSEDIKNKISSWKKENNFNHPVNLTLIPMDWKFEVGI
jgi:hypothetical protein